MFLTKSACSFRSLLSYPSSVKPFGRLLPLLLACFILTAPTTVPAGEEAEPQVIRASPTPLDRGKELLRQGAFGDAATSFQEAVQLSHRLEDGHGRCQALIALAQARYFTGQYRAALESLEQALLLAGELKDGRQMAAAKGALGNVHLAMGDYPSAERNFDEGLTLAQESGPTDLAAAILNDRGNLNLARKKTDEAMDNYRESVLLAVKAGNNSLVAQALINGATAAYRGEKYPAALPLLERATALLRSGESSSATAHGLINAGRLYADLRSHLPPQSDSPELQAWRTLNDALVVARKLNDQRTLSYAFGHLGRLYEENHQYAEALVLTRQAIFAAQLKNVNEALYQWHWQSGRIFAGQGKLDEAIGSYRMAIHDLQSVREELSTCYANPDASYRKSAGAVCYELVDLLLRRASNLKPNETMDPFLEEARDTLEILKVYELREYFKDDCVDAAGVVSKKVDIVSEKAVIVYPVLLPDRVELLVSFGGKLKRFTLPVSKEELTTETRKLRSTLVKRTTWEFLPHAQKLYDWLIRPLENELATMKPNTLVFVLDGPLRTIPMAALHDGNDFLISRYPVAITPSLTLVDPQPLNRREAKILSLGLTQAVQGFSGLPYVADELNSIKGLFPGEQLLNGRFRLTEMEKALKKESFSMVHIASHGQFGSEAADTFLLSFDEKFSMERFGQYVGLFKFREVPLDLLTLSACETAAGDDRAALGLAGVAVRSGARSALATLWHVNDPASYELITEFYRQLLTPGISRAAALQAAQLKLMSDQRYDHPSYWAPFLMINNWL